MNNSIFETFFLKVFSEKKFSPVEILCLSLCIFAVHWTLYLPNGTFRVGGCKSGKINFFSRLSEFFLASNIFGTFFAVFAIVSDTGLGGGTQTDVMCCCICV